MQEPDKHAHYQSIQSFVRWQLSLSLHYIQHTLHDIKQNKVNYVLGFVACFLVVFVVSLVVTIIGNTPVVFLRLAELQVGEADMEVSAGAWTESETLNYTSIQNILADTPYVYHTPRYKFSAFAAPSSLCPLRDPFDPYWKYYSVHNGTWCASDCFERQCSYVEYPVDMYVIDTKREEAIGMGRGWDWPSLSAGYLYMQNGLAKTMDVKEGDVVYIKFNILDVMGQIWSEALDAGGFGSSEANGPTSVTSMYLPFTISNTFGDTKGKFGTSERTGIIVEYDQFLPFLAKNLDSALNESTIEFLASLDLDTRAQLVYFNLPPSSRIPTYVSPDQDEVNAAVVQWASQILYRIGFNSISANLVVLSQLSGSAVVSLFLGLILNIIVFILLFLSIILIYSLLMINVDTKTFEMGVMRMIGTTRLNLVQLLLIQAFSYSLPAWAAGLLVAQLFAFLVASWFQGLTGVPIAPLLTPRAIILSTLLGILIPVAASILPIRNALGKNLHDSLDRNRSKTKAVQITIERAEDNTFSFPLLVIGFSLALFGFGVYYVFPLSLLAMNFSLLLNMFFLLLIGMLFGLVMLSLNLGQILETCVVWGFFWWENAAVPQVILKNLVAHRVRNRKTAVMYALSLGFIIFITVTYDMQEATLTYQNQQRVGAFIKVEGWPMQNPIGLEELVLKHSFVEDFAWFSRELSGTNALTNIGHVYRDATRVIAVSPNFFQMAIPGFLITDEVVEDPDIILADTDELAYQLYSEEGSKSIVIGTEYKTLMDLSTSGHSHLLVESKNENQTDRTRLKPMAFLDGAPYFRFSKYPGASSQSSLVSFSTYVRMSGGTIQSITEIPLQSMFIKVKSGTNDLEKDALIKDLDQFVRIYHTAENKLWVFDYRNEESPLETASVVLDYFFQFTTVIAMLISFFSLMSSMFTNIYEQAKEIGIMRAIGISKGAIYRIYIYEAFVLVFASSLHGVIIGTIMGYTVLLQRILFTQLPIPFVFPTSLLTSIFLCSILFSCLAVFSPIYNVLLQSVVDILRM